jgi:hypothetical protein
MTDARLINLPLELAHLEEVGFFPTSASDRLDNVAVI